MPLLSGGTLSPSRVVAPLDGDRFVATLLHYVVGESLEELGVLTLVHSAEDAGGSPATWVHWNINRDVT